MHILVVDDGIDSAQTFALLLKMWGHQVCLAFDGPMAAEIIRQQRPQLIFLDIGLPGMSGYEVARRVRAMSGPYRPLLWALTGHGEAEDRLRGQEAGFDRYFVKPVDLHKLEVVIAQAEWQPSEPPQQGNEVTTENAA